MDSPHLLSLAGDCEAASGSDRELDARIWCELNNEDAVLCSNLPRYTGSIDAAMTLVPRGWVVEIRRYFNSDGEYVAAVDLTDSGTVGRGCHPEEELTVQSRIVERRQGVDPTPSAICAAALRALSQSHSQTERGKA